MFLIGKLCTIARVPGGRDWCAILVSKTQGFLSDLMQLGPFRQKGPACGRPYALVGIGSRPLAPLRLIE